MNIISAYRHRVMRISPRRHRCRSRPRRPRARAAPYVRDRAGQRRRQRVRPDEAAWPRVHCDVTAVHHRRRKRNPHSRFANRLHGLL